MVKPTGLGSSIGISRVTAEADLDEAVALARQYGDHVIIESEVVGGEYFAGVVKNLSLPLIQIETLLIQIETLLIQIGTLLIQIGTLLIQMMTLLLENDTGSKAVLGLFENITERSKCRNTFNKLQQCTTDYSEKHVHDVIVGLVTQGVPA